MGSRSCRLSNLLRETLWISRWLLFCYLSSIDIFRAVAAGLVGIVVFFVTSPSPLLAFLQSLGFSYLHSMKPEPSLTFWRRHRHLNLYAFS